MGIFGRRIAVLTTVLLANQTKRTVGIDGALDGLAAIVAFLSVGKAKLPRRTIGPVEYTIRTAALFAHLIGRAVVGSGALGGFVTKAVDAKPRPTAIQM